MDSPLVRSQEVDAMPGPGGSNLHAVTVAPACVMACRFACRIGGVVPLRPIDSVSEMPHPTWNHSRKAGTRLLSRQRSVQYRSSSAGRVGGPHTGRRRVAVSLRDEPGVEIHLDEVSRQIIEQLQQDGRRSYAAIAKVVGLSEAAVRQRVQKLLDTGVMQIVAVTDPLRVGFRRQAMIGLKAEGDLRQVADKLAAGPDREIPMIVRGDGPYVYDQHGRRYLDGLSGLFVVQVGHGRSELAEAAAKQASELAYFPLWSYAHPRAVELAERLAALAPGDCNRVFFTSGGSEAVESAWKLARQYFRAIGQPDRYKVLSRDIAYHGTTMGALSITGLADIKQVFEPLVPGSIRVENTNHYRCERCRDLESCTLHAADDIERRILMEGPESVAAVYLEPVQNAGGCFPPPPGYFQRVREICDRYGVLLVSDEVICAFGRLGHWFGSERYRYQPDVITFAKGLTSGYAPMGGMVCRDFLMEPFLRGERTFLHGITFAGHPVSSAVALANLDVFEREDLLGNVRANRDGFRATLERLLDLPIVGDVRGDGFFYGIELVKDKATRETFDDDESERLLRGYLSPRLFEEGLVCRADDRGDPVIQLAPPLICGPEHFDEIEGILRQVLGEAWARL